MKKLSVFILLFGFSLLFAQGKVFLDVKTDLSEKTKMTHIKTLFSKKIMESKWANITEIGEEYQVWLRNYKKSRDKNVFTTTLDIEIREAKLFGEGDLIEKRKVNVRYVVDIDERHVDTHYELAEKMLGEISDELKTEAVEVSKELYKELESLRYIFYKN